MNDAVRKRIEDDVKNNQVFLYMKGTPQEPQCGFSAKATEILNQLGVEYKTFDIFTDEGIRQGVKEYADWPTIPQLYVNGEFVGGCDVMTEMYQNGELKKLLGK